MSNTSPPNYLDAQLDAIERITKIFWPERVVYLVFAIIAFVMLLACLVVALQQGIQNTTAVIGAFGASGVVAYTSSRVLLMWKRAMSIVLPPQPSKGSV
jgi:hypothetical protein